MTTTAICPVCQAPQQDGIACHTCVLKLERQLGDVASIVRDLEVTISRQSRVAAGSGGPVTERPETADDEQGQSHLAHERLPINLGAVQVADDLANCLTSWARAVAGTVPWAGRRNPTVLAASVLLRHIPEIRRHEAVDELTEGIADAIQQARRIVDRPADRQYLGTCLAEFEGVTCTEELFARPSASETTCKVCGITHEVHERRAWLLKQAEDMIVTVKEASSYLGEVGDIRVSQASIRGYIHRGKLAYRPGTIHGIRLGDLLTVVLDEGERRSA